MSMIVTGDDVALPVTLRKDGSVFAIANDATVKAALVAIDRSAILAGPVECSNAATGADWGSSLVVVELSSTITGALTVTGPVLLEIQVNDGGKLTWFTGLDVIKGSIE